MCETCPDHTTPLVGSALDLVAFIIATWDSSFQFSSVGNHGTAYFDRIFCTSDRNYSICFFVSVAMPSFEEAVQGTLENMHNRSLHWTFTHSILQPQMQD